MQRSHRSADVEEDEVTKAIAVVAHYDDAVIWAGGTIKRTLSLGGDGGLALTHPLVDPISVSSI